MNHTPGPWSIRFTSRTGSKLIYAASQDVLPVGIIPNDYPAQQANATLMASAPELLDALISLRKELWAHHKMNVRKDFSLMTADVAADKAIRKATGQG